MRSNPIEALKATDAPGVAVRAARPGSGPCSGLSRASRVSFALLLLATAVIGCGLASDLLRGPSSGAFAGPSGSPIADTDEDGIPDIAENSYTGTAYDRFDTDGDSYGDGLEQAVGSDPADYFSRPAEKSGARILVAPDGDDVYLVFVVASHSQFRYNTKRKALFVAYDSRGASAATALILNNSSENNALTMLESISGNVRSWTLKVRRQDIRLWSVGVGMREGPYTYCDGMLVNLRSNDCVYKIRFESEFLGTSRAEPTEPETARSPNPGQGFKECEQLSYCRTGSPLRHVLSERCETRDHYICPSDCGALSGQTIIDLKKVWLY